MQNAVSRKNLLFVIASLLLSSGFLSGSCSISDAEITSEDTGPVERNTKEPDAPPETVDKWSKIAKGLANPEWRWRKKAAEELGILGKDAKGAVPELIKALQDKNENVRAAVILSLGKIGPAAGSAARGIVRSLVDEDEKVKKAAANVLPKLGPAAVSPLVQMIDRILRKTELDRSSTSSLFRISDGEWRTLVNAARTLEKIGPEAHDAVTILMKLVDTKCGDPRSVPSCYVAQSAASDALSKVGSGAVPQLIKALNDKNSDIRRMAAIAIGKVGKDASEAVPTLIKMLQSEKSSECKAAATALGGIGSPAIPALLEALHDMRPMIREPAVKAMIRMGPVAKEAEPELKKMLKDKKRWTRRAAKDVLAKI